MLRDSAAWRCRLREFADSIGESLVALYLAHNAVPTRRTNTESESFPGYNGYRQRCADAGAGRHDAPTGYRFPRRVADALKRRNRSGTGARARASQFGGQLEAASAISGSGHISLFASLHATEPILGKIN